MTYTDALAIYEGSHGDATKRLYEHLAAAHGPAGTVALNLFRAVKCSERAKNYRRGAWRRDAYDRKQYSIAELCKALSIHGAALGIVWGWAIDANAEANGSPHKWLLYVEHCAGQCSFHTDTAVAGGAPTFAGAWDGKSSRDAMFAYLRTLLPV